MSIEQRGSLPYVFEELKANITEHGALGASGRTIEIAVARNVQATLDFSYLPGVPAKVSGPAEDCYPAEAAEVRWHKIQAVEDFKFEGLHMDLSVHAGFDLTEFLSESEIEALEEMIIKRAERF